MPEIDAYAILGVAADATREQIQSAYRRLARIHHPDCGGSHERMVELGEAYAILSHPERRREYDRACQEAADKAALAAWEKVAAAARAEAEVYPRNWSDFERFMRAAAGDFQSARYDEHDLDLGYGFGLSLPLIRRSVSGPVFIAAGVITASVLAWVHWDEYVAFLTPSGTRHPRWLLMALVSRYVLPPLLGAWVGVGLHWLCRLAVSAILDSQPAQDRGTNPGGDAQHRIVRCPGCSRQLRLPAKDRAIIATCPACRHRFDLAPEPALTGRTDTGARRKRRFWAIISLILLLSAAILAAVGPARRLLSARGVDEGGQLLSQRDYPAAVNAFDRAIKWDDSSAVAHHLRAQALIGSGRKSEAIMDLDRAIALAQGENRKSVAAKARRDMVLADAYLARAMLHAPNNEAVSYPRLTAALADASESIRRRPDGREAAMAYWVRANVHTRRGDAKLAADDWQRARALDPKFAPTEEPGVAGPHPGP